MKSLKTIGVLIIMLAVSTAFYFINIRGTKSSAQEVTITESSWAYKRSIFIENHESAFLSKKVTLEIDTETLIRENKLQTDCDDLRFQDSETNLSLDFQIESGCNTASTKIKILIPSLPAEGENIYMLYGNPQALPGSINIDNI